MTSFIAPIAPRLDRFIYRKSNGKRSFASIMTGLPIILVSCKGAKTGILRKVPLIGIPMETSDYIIVASNWGKKRNPSWYYNLKANPDVKVSRDRNEADFTAKLVDDSERDNFWEKVVETYKGYENYKIRASPRVIPLFVLQGKN